MGKSVAVPTQARNGNKDSRGTYHWVFYLKNVSPPNTIVNPLHDGFQAEPIANTLQHHTIAVLWFWYTEMVQGVTFCIIFVWGL